MVLLLPLLAKAITRIGSRTAMWVAAVPYMGGFVLLLLMPYTRAREAELSA